MQAKTKITIDPLTRRSLGYNSLGEEGVSLDPLGEQSGTSQISHNSTLTLESGEGGPIYSLSHEGIQQEGTQGGTHPAGPVVQLIWGGSTAGALAALFTSSLPSPLPRMRLVRLESSSSLDLHTRRCRPIMDIYRSIK